MPDEAQATLDLLQADPYPVRFRFLFPVVGGRPRYELNHPDALELRWSVFDRETKTSIGYGVSPEAAVDSALTTAYIQALPKPA